MIDRPPASGEIAQIFEPIVGEAHVLVDMASREEFSEDLIHAGTGPVVDCVVRPATSAEVAAAARASASSGLVLAPRGAGLSYTQGYVPSRRRTVALDLTRLNEIHDLCPDDLYMVVGAGTTWHRAAEAAKRYGLRPVLRGPISGSHSTVGGAASQGLMGATDGFLGFELVLADGRIVTTGSGASPRSLPFYRSFGPDLTGLFTGDTGAFGIKTKVALRLECIPDGLAMGSFSFPTLPDMVQAIVEIARKGLAPRLVGMDPLKTRTASKVGLAEAGRTLGSIAGGRKTVMRGLSDAVAVLRSGRGALDAADWGLHVHAEGHDDRSAREKLQRIREICLANAVETSPNIAIALHARPYSVRGMVGIKGERFVPIHAMFPLSRAKQAAMQVANFFETNQALFAREEITVSCLAGMEQGVFVIEPMFYWPDELGALHRRYLPADKYSRFSQQKPNPHARATVVALREELRRIFLELGAVHHQIGKFYDFAQAVEPATYELLGQLKGVLDPDYRLNPGNYGWDIASGEAES